jgi:hypothetical protein
VTFPTEVTLRVEIEVLDARRGTPGRYDALPEACYPAEPDEVELTVWLGEEPARLDVTAALPADILEALTAEALERLQDAADAALLP